MTSKRDQGFCGFSIASHVISFRFVNVIYEHMDGLWCLYYRPTFARKRGHVNCHYISIKRIEQMSAHSISLSIKIYSGIAQFSRDSTAFLLLIGLLGSVQVYVVLSFAVHSVLYRTKRIETKRSHRYTR